MKHVSVLAILILLISVRAHADQGNQICDILTKAQDDLPTEVNENLNSGKFTVKECKRTHTQEIQYFYLSKPMKLVEGVCRYRQSGSYVRESADGRSKILTNADESMDFVAIVSGSDECPSVRSEAYFFAGTVSDEMLRRIYQHWTKAVESDEEFNRSLNAYGVEGVSKDERQRDRDVLLAARSNLKIRSIFKIDSGKPWWKNLFQGDTAYYAIATRARNGSSYTFELAVTPHGIRTIRISQGVI